MMYEYLKLSVLLLPFIPAMLFAQMRDTLGDTLGTYGNGTGAARDGGMGWVWWIVILLAIALVIWLFSRNRRTSKPSV